MGNCRAKGTVATSPMVTRAQRRAQAAANRANQANAGPPAQVNPAPANPPAPANVNPRNVIHVAPVNQTRRQANQDGAGAQAQRGNRALTREDYSPGPHRNPNAHRDRIPRSPNRPPPQRRTNQGQGGGNQPTNVE